VTLFVTQTRAIVHSFFAIAVAIVATIFAMSFFHKFGRDHLCYAWKLDFSKNVGFWELFCEI